MWEVALALTFVGTAFALFFMGTNLDKDHYPLKLLFMFVGIFFLLSNLGMSENIINANNSTISPDTAAALISTTQGVYTSMIWVTVFVISYFLIYFFSSVARNIKAGKQSGK
jgi:hypothetical protein